MPPQTLSEKVWDRHLVHSADGEPDLLYIDLHLVHEVTSPQAFDGLRIAGRGVRRPELTICTEDHNVPTANIDQPIADPISAKQLETLRSNAAEFGLVNYPMGDPGQGIVHVIGPEQGRTQPGMTIVCGDSHTSTHGAFGALAFGIGTSEVEHVLATQTLPQQRAKTLAITVDGSLPAGSTAKDIILAILGRVGTGGGIGYIAEYRGSAIRALSMEGRMTVCNMSIEAGAKAGMIAPDDITFEYVKGRPHAPRGRRGTTPSPTGARSRPTTTPSSTRRSCSTPPRSVPHVSWGTNPGQVVPITERVPSPGFVRRSGVARRRRAGARVHGAHGRARRSARSASTRCSSDRARTAASRICASPPTSCAAIRWRPACARWSCPARGR